MASSSGSSEEPSGFPGIPIGEYLVQFTTQLGSGAFGTVYKATDKKGNPIAIKQINMEKNDRIATNEYAAFAKLNSSSHENLVKVLGVLMVSGNIWVAMELCEYGDLNKYFKEHFSEVNCIKQRVHMMEQIANGIAFLHGKDIAHRDIKPTNILVQFENGCIRLKLTDFGLAKCLDPDGSTSAMSTDAGTFQYKAPEFWRKTELGNIRYHKSIDTYAAGLTFLAILQARPGEALKPDVEDSLISVDTGMNIGMVMLMREEHSMPEINVAVCKETDSPMTKAVKVLVQKMTHVKPESRPNAGWVLDRLRELIETSGIRESQQGLHDDEEGKVTIYMCDNKFHSCCKRVVDLPVYYPIRILSHVRG